MYWNAQGIGVGFSSESLIETWDVLKYSMLDKESVQSVSLIETWDVLKFIRNSISLIDNIV